MNTNRPIVTGTFRDAESADRAYSTFRGRGYTDEDIHVVMSEETKKRYYDRDADSIKIEEGSKAMEGAGAGAAIGGTAGGVIGALFGVGGAVIIPGIGAIAGPLAGALAGAGAGGAAGSLVGALVGAGIPEEQAELYESDVRDGGIVMGVHPRNDEDHSYVRDRYTEYGARNVYTSEPQTV
ncbi:MAG: hypothetical protein Rubg2KO_09400 [Rubricoccaceae bacterium]